MKPSWMRALVWPNSNVNTMRGLCPRWDAQDVTATRWSTSSKSPSPPRGRYVQGHFTVLLVKAAHVKNVPGRKTDKADARWLAKLLRHGLLQASFIPPRGQRDVRDLTRYRTKLVQERAREVNRVQGVLERANIKLASVASDVLGVSGRAMLEALVD